MTKRPVWSNTIKEWNAGGAPRSREFAHRGAAHPANARPDDHLPAVPELIALSQTFTDIQEHSWTEWQQIKALTEADALLRRTLVRLEEQIQRARLLALYDELTGLPNRALLMDRINQAILRAEREKIQVGLLFLDMNGFKEVNDRLGHTAGDVLLRQVAQRLTDCLRAGDTAARYGGDEFIILLPYIRARADADTVVQRVQTRLAAPFLLAGELVAVTGSIGTATYPEDGKQPIDLIAHADASMYRAKAKIQNSRSRGAG